MFDHFVPGKRHTHVKLSQTQEWKRHAKTEHTTQFYAKKLLKTKFLKWPLRAGQWGGHTELHNWIQWDCSQWGSHTELHTVFSEIPVSEDHTHSSMTVSSETAVREGHRQSSVTVSSEDADVEGNTQSFLPASRKDAVSKGETETIPWFFLKWSTHL